MGTPMKYYLAGPMSGIELHNYPAFERISTLLRSDGYDIVSPHENYAGDTGKTYGYYIKMGLKALLECDGIIMMPGSDASTGATLEKRVAQLSGMLIVHYVLLVDPIRIQLRARVDNGNAGRRPAIIGPRRPMVEDLASFMAGR